MCAPVRDQLDCWLGPPDVPNQAAEIDVPFVPLFCSGAGTLRLLARELFKAREVQMEREAQRDRACAKGSYEKTQPWKGAGTSDQERSS